MLRLIFPDHHDGIAGFQAFALQPERQRTDPFQHICPREFAPDTQTLVPFGKPARLGKRAGQQDLGQGFALRHCRVGINHCCSLLDHSATPDMP